jgi:hypothetical protein
LANALSTASGVQLEEMHRIYREGGAKHGTAPHVIYHDATRPHDGCPQLLHALDFRLEAFGRAVHDPLVRAWWDDVGFVGRCPGFGGWVHFAIRGKRAVDEQEAQSLPQLPPNWADEAVIL